MANQYTSMMPRTPEEITERRLFVMKSRVRHMNWDEITKAVTKEFGYPISPAQCAEDFRVVMRQRAKELNVETATLREVSIQQLDNAASKIIDKVDLGDLDALETYLKIQTRKAKLLGLDAPVETRELGRQRLTADELLAKMAEISARLRAAKNRALPDGETIDAEVVVARTDG